MTITIRLRSAVASTARILDLCNLPFSPAFDTPSTELFYRTDLLAAAKRLVSAQRDVTSSGTALSLAARDLQHVWRASAALAVVEKPVAPARIQVRFLSQEAVWRVRYHHQELFKGTTLP